MKLSAALLATIAASASARSLSPEQAKKVIRAARRHLDQNAEEEEEENAYIGKYSMKFVGCDSSTQMMNEEGEVTYGAAMLRMCPTDAGCDSDSVGGCKEGYGDFVVSIEDFVDAYFEDQADNMNWDDRFDGDKYAKCEEYEPEVEGDDNPYENMQFFIGPTCSDDGDDIQLGFFSDEACTTASSYSFSDVSNGWTLPYSEGGLISKNCNDCYGMNENGEYELKEMCVELYEEAGMKCETEMEYVSMYGRNENSCDAIDEMLPSSAKPGASGWAIFGWIVFAALIIGGVFYVMWWRKKKQASGAADGMLA
jgi:hypothetical protein